MDLATTAVDDDVLAESSPKSGIAISDASHYRSTLFGLSNFVHEAGIVEGICRDLNQLPY